MCQKIADARTTGSVGNEIIDQTPLTTPFSISYDVGSGLNTAILLKGGAGTSNNTMGGNFENSGYLGGSSTSGLGGVMKDVTASFDRETRNCHVCTTVTTQSCKTTGSTSWFHNNRNQSCDTTTAEPFCEDIQM